GSEFGRHRPNPLQQVETKVLINRSQSPKRRPVPTNLTAPEPANDAQGGAGPSSRPPPVDVKSDASGSAKLPAHLGSLADRARDYVAAARSANTRRAYG